MLGSVPGEMAPESSQVVVLPKFDKHIYTSELTAKELKEAVTEYCIPTDLHPCLPPSDLTMDKLPSRFIGIYMEKLEHGGLRNPFSTFFLAVIKHSGVHVSQLVPMGVNRGHWFLFDNKTRGHSKKCFKEVTSSLKGWKKKFFLIDRRAVPNTMPWRHINTDVRDDFLNHHNEGDVEHLAEFPIPLRPSPRHLLYVCGLTIVCDIRSCPTSSRIPKERAKRAGEGVPATLRKKGVRQNQVSASSGSKRTISITLLHNAAPKPADETVTSVPKNTTGGTATGPSMTNIKKEIVDLSENTRVPTPLLIVSLPCVVHSIQSTHHEDNGESTAEHQYMSKWGLRVDLRICSFRACMEMIAHLATLAEEEFLSGLTNVKVVRHAYQSLGRCVLSQGELLKRHEQLNSEHVDLRNRSDTQIEELNRLRTGLYRQMQTNNGFSKQLDFLNGSHSSCEDKERELLGQLKEMEKERDDWRQTASEQVARIKELEEAINPKSNQLANATERVQALEADKCGISEEFGCSYRLVFHGRLARGLSLGKTEDDIATMLSKTSNLDIKGSRKLKDKHRELFTMQYPYVRKIADSYRLSVDALMKLPPDVPPPDANAKSGPSTENNTGGSATQAPPEIWTAFGAP
ncbi:hypothetical protein Tco_0745734 [Tanacetum coccineum]